MNAEKAYEALRAAYPSGRRPRCTSTGIGWGGEGLSVAPPPDWTAVENAPLPSWSTSSGPAAWRPRRRPGSRPRSGTSASSAATTRWRSWARCRPLEARDWLTAIDGIGKKTASIVLAFCFGAPLMAVDRHVERVSKRIGLIPAKATADQAHDLFLGLLEPDQMYAAHVLLIHHGRAICHAQNPRHDLCPVRDRCRAVTPKAR